MIISYSDVVMIITMSVIRTIMLTNNNNNNNNNNSNSNDDDDDDERSNARGRRTDRLLEGRGSEDAQGLAKPRHAFTRMRQVGARGAASACMATFVAVRVEAPERKGKGGTGAFQDSQDGLTLISTTCISNFT